MKSLSIGIVCPYDITKSGGVQEVVLAQSNELSKLGHKAVIIAPRPWGFHGKAPKQTVMLGRSRRIKALKTAGEVSISLDGEELDNYLSDNHFDILHFHEPWVPMMSRQILERSHSVNIATFHAKLPDTAISKTLELMAAPYTRKIVGKFDALTAVSDAAAAYVRTLTHKPITIIPNGIDLDRYQTANTKKKTKSRKQILYVGRLERRKGVRWLIKAFSKLNNKNVTLVIAGSGPEELRLKNYVIAYGIKGVQFLGYVSDQEKVELLGSSDLFCAPALYGESFGIVLLEAMATGLVTVAGNNPGYECVLKGTGQISLVNPKDTMEFARRLNLLLGDEKLRADWREWASREIGKYEYSEVVGRYIDLYKKALKKGL